MKVLVHSRIWKKSEEEVQSERKNCIAWLEGRGHEVVQAPYHSDPDERPQSLKHLVAVLNLMASVDAIVRVGCSDRGSEVQDYYTIYIALDYQIPCLSWDEEANQVDDIWVPPGKFGGL
jgi:hypothetical protein